MKLEHAKFAVVQNRGSDAYSFVELVLKWKSGETVATSGAKGCNDGTESDCELTKGWLSRRCKRVKELKELTFFLKQTVSKRRSSMMLRE